MTDLILKRLNILIASYEMDYQDALANSSSNSRYLLGLMRGLEAAKAEYLKVLLIKEEVKI